jgi:phage shock protein C
MNEKHTIKRLYLSDKDKKIAGVCGGIAEYFNVDSVAVRVLFLLITIVTAVFPMILFYILACLIIPKKPIH